MMEKRIKKRLLAVQGPLQFIAGHIAMEWYQHVKQGPQETETVLLMYDFLMPAAMEPEFVKVINRLAAPFAWHAIVFISGADMAALMKGKYSTSIARLQATLGHSTFDELVIARDFCGDGSGLLINAFPGAKRIVYGDAFGLVGNEAALAERFNWQSPLRALASRAKSMLRALVNGTHKKYPFDTAVLSMPLDWSGRFLDQLELLVPSKEFVVKEITAMSAAIPELHRYAEQLADPAADNYLILLSNLAASGLLTMESEAALYTDIIRKVVPPGGTVLLKTHPRGPRTVANLLLDALRDDYQTVLIDNAELASYPIELWTRLLERCHIVPVYSASAYQIKYIHGMDVILTLDDDRINRFFFPDKREIMSKGNQLTARCVEKIDTWDGQSPLWKGH